MEILGMSLGTVLLIVGGLIFFKVGPFKIRNGKNFGLGALAVGLVLSLGFSLPTTTQSVATGDITVTVHDGLSNITTTEDYRNDDKTDMIIYSADANIADGEEYCFNATIQRSNVEKAAAVKVTCKFPDKVISGVTEDNLIEKTDGKVDADINSGGTHSDDNTVWKYIDFAEGTSQGEAKICGDQEENFQDGMTDMSTYVTISCDADGTPFTLTVYANS